jgi:parvulin-like peptidyl-prolyl isomerase
LIYIYPVKSVVYKTMRRLYSFILCLTLFSVPLSKVRGEVVERIVAVVNSEIITLSELKQTMKLIENEGSLTDEKDLERKVLERMIEDKLLEERVREAGLTCSDQEVEAIWEEYKGRFPTSFAMGKFLEKAGISEADFKEWLRAQILRERLIELEVRPKVVLSDEERRKIEESCRTQRKISHILVRTKDEALEVLERLEGGAAFEMLAEKYSICPSRTQGGSLGFIFKGEMVQEFEEVAFSLFEGETSRPVKTRFGYHIIKCHKIRRTPEDLKKKRKESLEREALQKRFDSLLKEWITEIKKKAYIEVRL